MTLTSLTYGWNSLWRAHVSLSAEIASMGVEHPVFLVPEAADLFQAWRLAVEA